LKAGIASCVRPRVKLNSNPIAVSAITGVKMRCMLVCAQASGCVQGQPLVDRAVLLEILRGK
jgi:hypothetical protein